ncbi:rCG58880 [Rattus norvegicus]|uniref:RCG58880 n=1 Tax=Rattus norvegicus TaxID=10116 RepID=A6KRM8_RAT|nr:rCG58880 [Rattus norvegicus]
MMNKGNRIEKRQPLFKGKKGQLYKA